MSGGWLGIIIYGTPENFNCTRQIEGSSGIARPKSKSDGLFSFVNCFKYVLVMLRSEAPSLLKETFLFFFNRVNHKVQTDIFSICHLQSV